MTKTALTLLVLLGTPLTSLAAQRTMDLPRDDHEVSLEPAEVYSVGSVDGAAWETFAQVPQVAFDARGNLYVFDRDNARVVVVAPDGTLLREVGAEGGGPGELRSPMSMAVSRDGSVTIFDVGHMAFVRFGPDGSFIAQDRHDMSAGIPTGDLTPDPDGGVLFSGSGAIAIRSSSANSEMSDPDSRPIRRVLPGRDATVAYDAWQLPRETQMEAMSTGGGFNFTAEMPRLRAFEPGLSFDVLPDGAIVVADTIDYAVKIVDRAGRVNAVLRRPFPPRDVSRRDQAAERDRRRAEIEERAASGGMRMIVRTAGGEGGDHNQTVAPEAVKEMFEKRLETMEFADEIPVISGLATDWVGRIWIERTGDRIGEEGPTDIVTTRGEYVGTIPSDGMRTPAAFGPEGLVATIELDELDVPTIRVSRLPEGWR
jgi:hypothetical protein